jgi:hypothetical protein
MSFRRTSSKLLTVLTLLLTFTGQALAATVPCTMKDAAPVKMAAMSDHGAHHGHDQHSDSASPPTDEDCCEQGGCPMSSCMPAGLALNLSAAVAAPFASEKIRFSGPAFASASVASLYRPPISR